MNRTNQILAAALAIQVILAIILVVRPGETSDTRETGPLLEGFDPNAVASITITNDLDESLRLTRQGDTWVLPDSDNYPAQATTINTLLNKLAALNVERPIATSPSSHRQLGVAEDEFQRRLLITQDGTTYQLYLGTPGGPMSTHIRLDGENTVYLGEGLASWEADTQAGAWAVTNYFSLPVDEIIGVRLENPSGILNFTRTDAGTWGLSEATENQALNEAAFNTFLNQITAVSLRRPLGTDEIADYGTNSPQATITIRTRETLEIGDTPIEASYTLLIGAAFEEGYVLKASNSPFFVLVAATTVDPWLAYSLTDFINQTGG